MSENKNIENQIPEQEELLDAEVTTTVEAEEE